MVPSKCKIISALLLLFATTGCKENSIASLSAEGAILVIEPAHINFGSIDEGESKTGKVAIFNKFRFPVIIEKVSASCGCTSAKVADEVISPGGRSTLNVELSPQGRRGSFESTVSIAWREQRLNDAASGEVNAAFQAKGLYVANFTPGYVDFGTVSISEAPPTQAVSVSRGTQEVGFIDVKVSSESPAIGTSIVKKSHDQWLIKIKLSPMGLPVGPLRASTVIHFLDANGNDVHRSEISARGEIKGLVSAKPKSIFFGVLPQGVEKSGTISIDVPFDRVAEVKSIRIEPDSGCLKVKQGSKESTVEYTLRTEGRSGDLSGRLFLTFEDEGLGEISIPFFLHVRG